MNLTRKVTTLFQCYFKNTIYSRNLSALKVLSLDEDDNIKLQFKYSKSHNLVVRAPKTDKVQNLLARIKLVANLQHKKEEVRRAVMSRHSKSGHIVVEEDIEEDVSVSLFHDGQLIEGNISNLEALSQAHQLKIGEITYDVKFNEPTVIGMNLPDYIIAGCSLRPKFRLECANLEDCCFIWYRSISGEKIQQLPNTKNSSHVLWEDGKCWLKIHDGFLYTTCSEDIGCFLKLICIPKRGSYVGENHAIESSVSVQRLPDPIPFEKRQKFTSILTDDESIRCVSYNTLANSYVEKRKFPYCSVKARDNYYRKQLLSKELKGYRSDILCLQEVEERAFTYDLSPILKEEGFEGLYKKKGGRRNEGLATFFRSSKFKLIKSYGVLLNDIIRRDMSNDLRTRIGGNYKDISVLLNQESAFQISLLQTLKNPRNTLLVANTHLYSNKDTPEVRLLQAAVCTNYIEHTIQRKNLETAGVIFCGDFNSLPNSDAYEFITSGKCNLKWKNGSNPSADTQLLHNLNLGNACGTANYTNYTEEFSGCLDYIFYSKNHFTVTEVVPMPEHEDVISQTALPNEYFPSDHIAIICTLKWNVLRI